jgi:hypothetical protein
MRWCLPLKEEVCGFSGSWLQFGHWVVSATAPMFAEGMPFTVNNSRQLWHRSAIIHVDPTVGMLGLHSSDVTTSYPKGLAVKGEGRETCSRAACRLDEIAQAGGRIANR